MDAAATFTNDDALLAALDLPPTADRLEAPTSPAFARLAEQIGPELARRLVDALATRLR